jgi:hypothetical protein
MNGQRKAHANSSRWWFRQKAIHVWNLDVARPLSEVWWIEVIFLDELLSHLTHSQIQIDRYLFRDGLYQSQESDIFRKRWLLRIWYRLPHGPLQLHNFPLSDITKNIVCPRGRVILWWVIDNSGATQCVTEVVQYD